MGLPKKTIFCFSLWVAIIAPLSRAETPGSAKPPHFSLGLELGISMPSMGGTSQRMGLTLEALIRVVGHWGIGYFKYSSSKAEPTGTYALSMSGWELNYFTLSRESIFRVGLRYGSATLTISETPVEGETTEPTSATTEETTPTIYGTSPGVTALGAVVSYDIFVSDSFTLGGAFDLQFLPKFQQVAASGDGVILNFSASVRYWF